MREQTEAWNGSTAVRVPKACHGEHGCVKGSHTTTPVRAEARIRTRTIQLLHSHSTRFRCCCFSRMVPKPTRVNEQRRCINCNTTDAETDSKYKIFEDVCVMVSPNRQSHIVAMYGKYRNITPPHQPASTSPANQHTEAWTQPRREGTGWHGSV